MAIKRDLKAYVRYDGSGRIIPGSLILNRFKPAVGNWKETPAYLCCNPLPLDPNCIYFTIESTEGFQDLGYGFSVVDDGGDPVTFNIDFGDGGSIEIILAAGASNGGTHTYELGTYNGKICMSDPTRVITFRTGND